MTRPLPRRFMRTAGLLDAVDLMQVDAEWRQPVEAVAYGCRTRCYSTDHVNRLQVVARVAHIFGVSYDAEELGYWRRWAEAGLS